jgi:hypothetical protein
MSAIAVIGIPIIAMTVLFLIETEIAGITKELINILVRTTNYTLDKIIQIIHLYY